MSKQTAMPQQNTRSHRYTLFAMPNCAACGASAPAHSMTNQQMRKVTLRLFKSYTVQHTVNWTSVFYLSRKAVGEGS